MTFYQSHRHYQSLRPLKNKTGNKTKSAGQNGEIKNEEFKLKRNVFCKEWIRVMICKMGTFACVKFDERGFKLKTNQLDEV